jgi:DNA-binding FadR family transcriptional regulator
MASETVPTEATSLPPSDVDAERGRLSDHVLGDIVREIVSGRWPVGSIVPSEPELAAHYNFSKVVVRESIRRLSALGLLRVRQGKRSIVLDESSWDLHAIPVQLAYRTEGRARELLDAFFEARLVIEPEMAVMAVKRATNADLDELGLIIEDLFAGLDTPDPRAYRSADASFHAHLGRIGRNMSLRAVMRDLMRYVDTLGMPTAYSPSEMRQMTELHREIGTAIIQRDADAARRATIASSRYVHSIMSAHLPVEPMATASRIDAAGHSPLGTVALSPRPLR